MARRDLLTPDKRQVLFGVATERENLALHYMLSCQDLALVATRRGETNQIGFAVQLGLLRHPGFGFTLDEGAPIELVAFMGEQIGVPIAAFERYASRPATASVHAREAEAALGLRPPVNADLPLLIKAATQAAWATDRGVPIVAGITDALRVSCITLPSPSVIERAGLAGRARARQRAYQAMLAGVPADSIATLDSILIVDPQTGLTPLACPNEPGAKSAVGARMARGHRRGHPCGADRLRLALASTPPLEGGAARRGDMNAQVLRLQVGHRKDACG